MFSFEQWKKLPEKGGRAWGGGLVDMESTIVWGGGGGVYMWDGVDWSRVADGGERSGTLAVNGRTLVWFGGKKDGVCCKKVMKLQVGEGGWSPMSDMLVGCWWSCVCSVRRGDLVVIGGISDTEMRNVQVFNGTTQSWQRGPPLPKPCWNMSAVVHGDLIFMMGGVNIDRAVYCADIRDLTVADTRDTEQSIWRKLPDAPYYYSTACVVDGYLLAIGGTEDPNGIKKVSSICGFHSNDQKWKHIGDIPFACWFVDTLLLSDGGLLVVDAWETQQVFRMTVEDLAKLFLITPSHNKTENKSQHENERRLYEEAMTKGYVETSVTKCLVLGAAGVGKTHLKHLLLKKDPPEQRVSTGLADNPVRAISFSLAGVSEQEEDDWFLVEDDQALLNVVGDIIKGGSLSVATSLDKVVGSFPKMTIHASSDEAGGVQSDPLHAGINVAMDTHQQNRSVHVSVEEELIYLINYSSDKKKLSGVKWIQFMDSGGQLQYHDILPLFIQNPGVTIFVLKLSENLSHKPAIEYYGADGKPVGNAYQSSLSHMQIFQQCLGAMCSKDVCPLIIVVGTHRDIADQCSETIDEKNQQLFALLNAGKYDRVLCNGEKLVEVIFAVNGTIPQDEDRYIANILRQKIVSVCPQLVKMPIAWFGLEVLLHKSSHDGILSLVECQACAKSLHIEGDAFSAALHHLVNHSAFLYYPEVLPQTVFCDPQVVLTKVNELVQYHYKLLYRPDKGVAAERTLVKFRDYGLLSVELLNKFSNHYTEGLFTPQDLLKLLRSVRAIAKTGDGGEYMMPALLPHLDSGQVSKYCQQVTSLIIRPTEGCVPSGLFCCLVAHLLSPSNQSPWKVCMDGDKPLCLYRNCISFQLKQTTKLVTLVDMFSYILVHVDKVSSKVCRETRDCVYCGIMSACGILKSKAVLFEDAFMCAGSSCTSDPPHVAIVMPEKQWRCSIRGHQCGDLGDGQLMWFGDSCVTKQDPTTSVPVSLDSEPSMQLLIDKVAAVIPNKCEMVGLQLGLTLAQLQAICPPHQGLKEHYKAFIEIFDVWRRLGSRPYTWRTLIDVLRSASVGEVLLSDQLITWITQ